MTRILMNCVLIFIIVPHELITVWSENNILEKTWSRKKITKALKDMNLIELTEFQYPILIAPNEIASNNGTLNCETFKTIQNKRPKTYNGVADMQCYGWIDSCQSIRDDITRKHPAIYCFSERYKRLTWVRDGNSTQYGYETRKCKKTKLQSDNATKSKKDINNTCLCKCTRKSDNPESNTTNWAFSLQPQISNIENNKVVTGVRIANHSKMIYLEIKERRIGSYEDDNWKPPVSLKDLKRDVDYIFLRPDSRSINLDVIFLPDNYVVTGVKFSKIRVAYAEKRGWALRLKVQGTQIDWATKKLLTNTSTWFDSDTFAESSTDHKQKRYGISMQRLDPSSPMHDHDKVYESNTYVEFTTTELIRDLGRFTIPYMNTSPIQARTNKQLLDGVGLVYKGNKNYVDYIIPVVRSTLNSDFENNATVAIMAKRNQTDVFMNEDVEDITILNENQIKSVVTNDKKIPGSRLENITIKTTTEETIEKKYTIDERRSQLTTGKKNQANESLTDARNQLEKPMSAKETVKISTIEAVVAGRSVTEEQNTVSILTTESKEQEFLTIGSSKNSIEYEYSGINATQKIMPVVNAIGEKIKESDRLEKMTGKEILLEKSVIEANTTEVTIGKGSTTHTGFINIKRLEKINKNKSISQANTPEVIITEKESNAGKQTTELVVLEGNIRQEFHENGSIEDNLLDAHSEKSTTEDIMTADNTIELTTENHRATIATQLESSTTEKILSEISVKEKNKMEVNTEKQNMMLADAIMESSMIPASEDSNMTEEQTILPTTTDKSMQEKIYKSESSDTNLTDAYIEKSLTEESTTIRNAIESTTENQGVIIGSYLESTTTNENSGGIGVEEKIEMQTTTEKLNMMLGEAIVETSTTEATTERSSMKDGEIMISSTTIDSTMLKEIYESESSDINMIDAYSEKGTTTDVMITEDAIKSTTENDSATIGTQLESTTTEKIWSEIGVKERNKMEVTTEKQNMMLAGVNVKSSTTEVSNIESSMIDEEIMISTTTDRTIQEETYKIESSDMNMTNVYSEKSTTEESMTTGNAIESTTENQSVIIGPYLGSTTTNENSGEIGVEEKIEMQTTTEKLNMMLGEAIVETSTTETTTERSNMIKGEIMISTTTDRTIQEEIYKIESSNINMTNDYSEKSTTEESMTTGNVIESTTENHSSTIGAYLESTTTEEFLSEIGVKERNKMEVTTEKQNMMLAGATVKFSTIEASTIESSMTDGGIMISTTTDSTIQEETYKIESSDMNMTNVYSEKSTTEESMTTGNAIESTTENQSVIIGPYLESITTNENSGEIGVEEKIEMQTTTEKLNMMLGEAIVETSTTEATTERSSMIDEEIMISTTVDSTMLKEIYESESSDINMIDAYSEKSTTTDIMTTENAIESTTENYSSTIGTQLESTTTEKIWSEIGVKERYKMEVTTEKQNMMLAGATVKSSTTEASTIESSMTDGGIMISTSTDRTIQEETYKIESSDMNITNVYSEKSTTVDIMTAENSIEASTENQRVTIIEESTNNNIMEVTGVKKALIDEYEIDRNISESTPREETLTNKIMSNENTSTLKKPDEEEISTKVVIEETTVMVPEIITANTLETITEAENLTNVRPAKNNTTEAITDERNVAERQYTILTTTKQSMRNELYTSESSAIHMLDAYSERNVTAEITLPGDTTETITENYNITTTSQTKSITVTKIQSEESVKERNDIETITETAKTSTMKIKTEVEHMKEAENIEANMVGKVRIDEARKDILKERTSVPTIENRFMIETIEKEGIISKIKTKNTDIEIPHLKFHVERAKNMSEISTKNINRTEVTTVKENDFEETAADVSTGNKTMGKEFITEKKLTENRINEAIAIEENTMEKSLKNEPHSSGSLEISELQTYLEKSTTEKALERENTIKTQTSNNSTTDKTTAETTMQNDELVKYKNMLESNAAKKSITKKTTIMKNEKGLEQSTLGRCRTRKRWQDNSGNTLHVHIISHVIILISIILVL